MDATVAQTFTGVVITILLAWLPFRDKQYGFKNNAYLSLMIVALMFFSGIFRPIELVPDFIRDSAASIGGAQIGGGLFADFVEKPVIELSQNCRLITGLRDKAECYAKKHGVEPALFVFLVTQESVWMTDALNAGSGAAGLVQLMDDTAKNECQFEHDAEFNITSADDRYDADLGMNCGAFYLSKQIIRFGVEKGLAAYNAGPGNVKKHGGIPPFKETKQYVKDIMAQYRQHQDGGLIVKGGYKGQAFQGGDTHRAVFALAAMIQWADVGRTFVRFTGFNDDYHKEMRSQHAKGLALDFIIAEHDRGGDHVSAITGWLKQVGLTDQDFVVIDEYANLSGNATGGHIHVEFANTKSADKFMTAVKDSDTYAVLEKLLEPLGV